jgi:hypothetical protein
MTVPSTDAVAMRAGLAGGGARKATLIPTVILHHRWYQAIKAAD